MNCTKSVRLIALAAAALAFTAVNANADFITGYGWVTTEAIVGSATGATKANLPGTSPDVSFTTTGLNLSSSLANGTVAQWMSSSTFPLHNLVDKVAASQQLDPTIWEFFGNISVTSSEVFSISQDDGVTLYVNDLQHPLFSNPGPNSLINEHATYTGPTSGNVPFEVIYTECCGGPAAVQIGVLTAPATVPEPGSIVLLGTVVCGIVFFRRRRNAKSSPR